MNLFDKAIAAVAPSYGLKRAQARQVLRSYDGAATGRRRTGFGGRAGSANAAIGPSIETLRNRARSMVRNTAHGASMVEKLTASVVGTGIVPVWNTGGDRLDKQLTLLWEQWERDADVEGELSFGAQQELAVRSMIEGGETVVRFVDLRPSEGGPLPFRVQILEGDFIDTSRVGRFEGRDCRLGVVVGQWGRRLGYYLFDEHPGELLIGANYRSRFVDRADVRHLYRPLRIGQLRGVSWLAPVLLASKDLATLLESTIVKAGVEAAFSGFVTNTMGGASPLIEQKNTKGERETLPEPGMLLELGPGQDVKFAEPKTSTQFEPVAGSILRAMAAGVGLTYDQVTGDLRQANYSSLRAGKIEHRRLIEQVQFNVVIPRLCDPVADRFISRALLAGLLRDRKDGFPRTWVPPANEPIDPKKDLEADIAAVRAGRMSPQEFIGQWGRDWRKVTSDAESFWKHVDALGLTFDIDPRKALAGAPAAAAADVASEDDEDDEDAAAKTAAGKKSAD